MSIATVVYLAALALIYGAERFLADYETAHLATIGAALAALAVTVGLRVKAMSAAEDEGLRFAHRRMLDFIGISGLGLGVYVVQALELLEGKPADALPAVWPPILLLGAVGLLVLDNTVQGSPVVIPVRQVKRAMWNGIGAALAVALVFPVNYLADRHDERWNLSYFKTAEPGTATKAIVGELPEKLYVRIFQGAASDVTPELQNYFAGFGDSPNLEVEVLDQAADPELARELRVGDNGYIAVTAGKILRKGMDDEEKREVTKRPKTHLIKVGTTLDDARGTLRNLDKEVQKALLVHARGDITVYVTVGHGELTWTGEESPLVMMAGLKQIFEDYMNFKLKRLGLTEGLAETVPDDADVVLVLGPSKRFHPAEVESLRKYVDRGGALLLAVEPELGREQALAIEGEDPMNGLLEHLGLRLGEGVIAANSNIVPVTRNVSDRLYITTDRFSSHASTVVLAKNRQLKLFTPLAGHLEQVEGSKAKTTVTVRSMPQSWADTNRNLELDEDAGESASSRPIAAVSEGGTGESAWRALVVADATLLSDLAIGNAGNQQFVHDGMNWLIHQEAVSGELGSEEDVRIEHTKEGQAVWFYLTVIGFPILLLGFGGARLRNRRKGGRA